SVADGFISVILLLALTVFRRGQWARPRAWRWWDIAFVIALASAGQVIGETIALRAGEWGYTAAMPLLILAVFWLANRVNYVSGTDVTKCAKGRG
ncbi:MAG: hypothetical protein MUQ10_18535, partial [Anaerolineae bacterium]|nr:hypothetical protein [Anaerolineae bacterium]